MTQVQAMKALADSIERLVKSGSSGSGGFIDRFIQGFTVGIQRSREFRGLMRDLRRDLRIAYWEGIKVGKAFVEMFPGVKDVFKGIREMFEPARFRAMFRAVGNTFKQFFSDMTTNPQMAIPKLLENLKKNFFDWFSVSSEGGRKTINGFKAFFVSLSKAAAGLLKIAMVGVRDGVKYITDLISGRTRLSAPGANGALGFLGQLIAPMVATVREIGPSLWAAVKGMFGEVRKKAEPWLRAHFLDILGVLFGPALIGVVGRTFATTVAGIFSEGLIGFVKNGGIGKAFNSIKGLFTRKVEDLTHLARSATPPPIPAGARRSGDVIRGAEDSAQAATGSRVNWGRALVMLVGIAAFMYGMVNYIMPAILDFATKMKSGGLSVGQIAASAGAMVATAGAVALMSVAVSLVLKAGETVSPAGIAKGIAGLAIIAGVAAAMVWGAGRIIEKFKGYDISSLGKTVVMMTATGAFFLAAAGVTAIAAGIGAIALAGGGLGALAIGVGLAAIALTVEGMSVQGIRIMNAIKNFNPGPGFAEKARVFVEIMKGVSTFTVAIAQLVAASRPGFFTFLNVGNEQRETLKSVNTMVSNLSGQIIRIVETLRSSINSLGGSEAQLRGAQALGSILGGIAELGKALQPSAEAMRESGWYSTLTGGGEDIATKISATTDFINDIAPQLRMFVRMISEMFSGQGAFSHGMTADQERAATSITGILKGVAEFANSLRSGSSMILQMSSGGNQEAILRSVGAYMSTLMVSLTTSGIFQKINEVITTIVTSLGALNPGQVAAVQALAPVLGPAFNVISQIGSVIASMAVPARGPAESNAGAIYQLTNLVSTFFDRIKTDLPTMVTNMRTAFAGMSPTDISSFAKGMEGISRLFAVVATFPALSKSLNDAGGSIGINNSLVTIAQVMTNFAFQLMPSNVNGLTAAATQLSPMVNNLTEIIQHTHYQRLGAVITGMVHEVNQLATTIQGLQPINIETSLHRLGDSLGLGSEGEYTIQNRNFNINVNFVVKFDNNGLDAFELAMLRRVGPNNTRITHGDLTP